MVVGQWVPLSRSKPSKVWVVSSLKHSQKLVVRPSKFLNFWGEIHFFDPSWALVDSPLALAPSLGKVRSKQPKWSWIRLCLTCTRPSQPVTPSPRRSRQDSDSSVDLLRCSPGVQGTALPQQFGRPREKGVQCAAET
jgi:hypothetical protein